MKCSHVALGPGVNAIVCGGRRYQTKVCSGCGKKPASKLCDWIIARGTPAFPTPRTCDAPLCDDCAYSPAEGKDLCKPHRAKWALHPRHPRQQEDHNDDCRN